MRRGGQLCVCVCAAGGQQMGEPVVECARLLSVSCGYTGWGQYVWITTVCARLCWVGGCGCVCVCVCGWVCGYVCIQAPLFGICLSGMGGCVVYLEGT